MCISSSRLSPIKHPVTATDEPLTSIPNDNQLEIVEMKKQIEVLMKEFEKKEKEMMAHIMELEKEKKDLKKEVVQQKLI